MKHLVEIFQYYLGATTAVPTFPDEKQLEWYVRFANKQRIAGFLLDALVGLPIDNEQKKRCPAYSKLLSLGLRIEETNKITDAHIKELVDIYARGRLRSCVIKGQGLCNYYPIPQHRSPGDIDLWVDGKRKEILTFTKNHYEVDEVVYHHLHAKIFEKTDTEIHFCPTWMFCPLTNYRLQRFFKENAEEQFSNWNERLQCAIPTARFNAVFLLIHTYRHLFDEGISLKQVLDYYYTLLQLSEEDRLWVVQWLVRLHMQRFTAAMMDVLEVIFGLKREWMLTEPDNKEGERLFMEIVHPCEANRKESFLQYNIRRAKHRHNLFKSYPEEVFWAPFFKGCQLVWRLYKGYKRF